MHTDLDHSLVIPKIEAAMDVLIKNDRLWAARIQAAKTPEEKKIMRQGQSVYHEFSLHSLQIHMADPSPVPYPRLTNEARAKTENAMPDSSPVRSFN